MEAMNQNQILDFLRQKNVTDSAEIFIQTLNMYCAKKNNTDPVQDIKTHIFLAAYIMTYFPALIAMKEDAEIFTLIKTAKQFTTIVDQILREYNSFEEIPKKTSLDVLMVLRQYKDQHRSWCLADKTHAVQRALKVLRVSYHRESLMSDEQLRTHSSPIHPIRKFIARFGKKEEMLKFSEIHLR